jgi:hypothetical protein
LHLRIRELYWRPEKQRGVPLVVALHLMSTSPWPRLLFAPPRIPSVGSPVAAAMSSRNRHHLSPVVTRSLTDIRQAAIPPALFSVPPRLLWHADRRGAHPVQSFPTYALPRDLWLHPAINILITLVRGRPHLPSQPASQSRLAGPRRLGTDTSATIHHHPPPPRIIRKRSPACSSLRHERPETSLWPDPRCRLLITR